MQAKLDAILAKVKSPALVLGHDTGGAHLAEVHAFSRRLTRIVCRGKLEAMGEEMCRCAKAVIAFVPRKGPDAGLRDLLERADKYGLKIRKVGYK
jgi:hypothetical protein